MIGIYLCDDEPQMLSQLQTALEGKICMENYDMKVMCAAASADGLLKALQDRQRGIYFLDVDLKDEDWDGFCWVGKSAEGIPWHSGLHHQLWRPGLADLPVSSGSF